MVNRMPKRKRSTKSAGNPCAAAGGRRRCVKPGYRVTKKRTPSAKNKCIAREMSGKSYGTQAKARTAFKAAVAKCSGRSAPATRKKKGKSKQKRLV
jgi:hypothetical protein